MKAAAMVEMKVVVMVDLLVGMMVVYWVVLLAD